MNSRNNVVREFSFLSFLLCLFLIIPSAVMAELTLQSSFDVTGTYTDNLFFVETGKKSDIGVYLGPSFSLQYTNPDIVIGVQYFGSLQLFFKNSNANGYNQNMNIILDLPFLTKQYKRLTVTVDETINFSPQLDAFALTDAQEQANQGIAGSGIDGGASTGAGASAGSTAGGGSLGSAGGAQGIFTRRASSFQNTAGATIGYAWTQLINTTLGYTNHYQHFFDSGFQDSITHTGYFSIPLSVGHKTTITPSYYYTQTIFTGESTQETSGDKIITHSALLGISYSFTPTLTVSGSGGVAFTKQKGAEEVVFDSMGMMMTRKLSEKFSTTYIGSVNISKNYQRGTMALEFNQTINSGGGLASQATRTRALTGRIRHGLSRRINATFSVGWAQNDSLDGEAFDSQTYRIQAGLGYSLLSWLFCNASYSHINQSSSGSAASDLQVNQVFLGMTAVADPWFIFQ